MANLDLVLSISVIIMIVINIIFSYQDYSDFWGLEDYGPLRFIMTSSHSLKNCGFPY